jgi:hypothetical protein
LPLPKSRAADISHRNPLAEAWFRFGAGGGLGERWQGSPSLSPQQPAVRTVRSDIRGRREGRGMETAARGLAPQSLRGLSTLASPSPLCTAVTRALLWAPKENPRSRFCAEGRDPGNVLQLRLFVTNCLAALSLAARWGCAAGRRSESRCLPGVALHSGGHRVARPC